MPGSACSSKRSRTPTAPANADASPRLRLAPRAAAAAPAPGGVATPSSSLQYHRNSSTLGLVPTNDEMHRSSGELTTYKKTKPLDEREGEDFEPGPEVADAPDLL